MDNAIVLYLESLQAAFRFVDKWKENISTRAAIAMLISTLNYVLLARHGILLGYYPEVQDLLRSCYERTYRCYLFFNNYKFARKFLEGKQISQSTVDKEVSNIAKDMNKRDELLNNLRKYYGFLSTVAHPNLKSFQARYGIKEINERVGLVCVFGGLMGLELGHVSIIRILQTTLSALRILGIIIHDETGSWDKEFQIISKKCDEMIVNLPIRDINLVIMKQPRLTRAS
ncbi:MAG: hypothetical protein PHQ86_00165 [Dehalococcoidales bacterium]|nr:hypothetical protein [Dehalococcoidales bacterium]